MLEEVLHEHWMVLEIPHAASDLIQELRDGVGGRVGHPTLEHRVRLLFRVQLGRVGWQRHDREVLRARREEGPHLRTAMRIQPIPDDGQWCPDPSAEMRERAYDVDPVHAPGDMPRVGLPLGCDRDDARDLATFAHPAQHRRLAARRPRRLYAGPKRVTRLVHAGNGVPRATSPLFTAGQSCTSHA